jgi:hypothetical protein
VGRVGCRGLPSSIIDMIFLLLVALMLWSIVGDVRAQEAPDVVINEIMWAKSEYIELLNKGTTDASLDGWYITRQKPPVNGVDQPEEIIVTFGASDVVGAEGYFLVESSEGATEVPSNKIKSSLGLIDGGVVLRLYSQDASEIDNANQLGGWFAGENNATGASMERVGSDGRAAEAWQTSVGDIGNRVGTPGQGNSEVVVVTPSPVPSPTVTPTPEIPIYSLNIHINEFLPDSVGDDTTQEFIELVNSDNETIDISSWILDDVINGGSSPFIIPEETTITGRGFLVFLRTQTKISMNNDSDHIRLVRPDGIVQEDIPYSETKEGHSYNRISQNVYEKSSTITPNTTNIITISASPTPKPAAVLEEEKEGSVSYDFSPKIFIHEFLPNPIGADTDLEFIELKSDDKANINLFGWILDDALGGSTPYRFGKNDSIASGKIVVLFRSKTKLALNNDEDSVRLIDPNGKVISSVRYNQKVVEGQSYNRTSEGSFVWSDINTPGDENTIYIQEKVSPSPKPKVAKKVPTPKKKASIRKATMHVPVSRVLSAQTSVLPWPETIVGKDTVSRSVVGDKSSFQFPQGRQGIFVFFGVTVAFMQGWSGFSHKERIWQK